MVSAPAHVVGQGAPTSDIGTTDLYWGTWGQGLLTDWWETTADLIWPQSVITYGRMRHDPQLRGVLMAYLLPLLRATWAVDGTGCRDEVTQQAADDCGIPILGADPSPGPARRRGVNFRRHLRSALYDHLVYGHMPFELRYRIDGTQPGDCHLDHLGARMPWTIAQIHLNPDATIQKVVQTTQRDPLPANRLLWYVNQQEGANWAGISMLRPAFGAWLLKHETWRVHASGIRRFAMGIPQVTAPAGATTQQVQAANDLASQFRAGDQAGVGLPQGFTFSLQGMVGNAPDALGFIQYLDTAMAKMALAGLLELGQSEKGSRTLGETFLDLFLLSLQAVADEFADTFTTGQDGTPGVLTDLVDQNWGEDEPAPRLVCTDVGENYEVTAEAIARLSQFGALSPDPALDDWIRRSWRLPARVTEWIPTSRGIPAPGEPAGPEPDPNNPNAPVGQQPEAVPQGPDRSGGPQPAAASRRRRALASGQPPLHRELSLVERQAGFQAAAHQAEWVSTRDQLVAAWAPVARAQRQGLADQVGQLVRAGRTARLATLKASGSAGVQLLTDAMVTLAQSAAVAMSSEAAGQGVHIPMGKVKVPTARLGRVAAARADLAAAYLAQQAGGKALQVVRAAQAAQPTPDEQGDQATDDVLRFLEGLSVDYLADQLGAALTTAQNAGRIAVLEAAPVTAATPAPTYTASEVLDHNTCKPCEAEDGAQLGSLAEAAAAYPNGGFIGCLGGLRCRGTIVATWPVT